MAQRLTDFALPLFEKAFAEHGADDEDLLWDIGLITLPDPGRQGRFFTSLVLTMSVPGAVEGTTLHHSSLMEYAALTEDFIDETVATLLSSMRADRVRQPDVMAQQQEQAVRNGQTTPDHGYFAEE